MYKSNILNVCVLLIIGIECAYFSLPVNRVLAGEIQRSNKVGPVAIVFKQESRYNTYVQGKFERLLHARSIEFPIGKMPPKELLKEIKGYGLRVDYLVLVNLQEEIKMDQTAVRPGGKQGLWSSHVAGEISLYDVETQNIIAPSPVQITIQYDDRGSLMGNAVRSLAEKGLGEIYYYEQTPDQRILYWLSDQVKDSLGDIVEGMMKSNSLRQVNANSKTSERKTPIDSAKTLFENSLDLISTQIIQAMKTSGKKTIAVTDFQWMDRSLHDLEAYISEELITRLANEKSFTVVERALRDRAVTELKFNISDLVDPDHAKQFGKFTGADTILVGSLTNLGYKYKVNCRLVDTESGEVYGAVAGSIYNDERLESLMAGQ